MNRDKKQVQLFRVIDLTQMDQQHNHDFSLQPKYLLIGASLALILSVTLLLAALLFSYKLSVPIRILSYSAQLGRVDFEAPLSVQPYVRYGSFLMLSDKGSCSEQVRVIKFMVSSEDAITNRSMTRESALKHLNIIAFKVDSSGADCFSETKGQIINGKLHASVRLLSLIMNRG